MHLDPYILPWQQVDKGAIKFVLSGANIMCPGLTSPGAKMTPAPKGTVVVSFCNCLEMCKKETHGIFGWHSMFHSCFCQHNVPFMKMNHFDTLL